MREKPQTESQRLPDKGAVYGLLSLHGHSSRTLPQLVPPELATAYLPGSGPIAGSALAILTVWRFPKTGGTLLGVPIIRTVVYYGLYYIGVPLFWETTI